MRILCNAVLRRVTTTAAVNKQITKSSNKTLSACIFQSKFSYIKNQIRAYCSLLHCFWPANLPPATEWGYDKPGK